MREERKARREGRIKGRRASKLRREMQFLNKLIYGEYTIIYAIFYWQYRPTLVQCGRGLLEVVLTQFLQPLAFF